MESGNPLNFSFANSPYDYYPTFAGARRPDLVSTPEVVDNWRDIGGDRFNQQNRNPIVDINHFAYPGGCPNSSPSAADKARCSFLVGNAGSNILTGTPLYWSQLSAQKNFRFGERFNAQLRWDFRMRSRPTTSTRQQPPLTSRTRGRSASWLPIPAPRRWAASL